MLRDPRLTRNGKPRTPTAVAFLAAVMLGLAACGSGDEPAETSADAEPVDTGDTLLEESDAIAELEEAAREEGKVVIYGSQEEVIYDDLIAAWEERYPEIEVELVYYSGADEWERILAEISAGVADMDGITPTVQNPERAADIGAFDETIDWASYGVPDEYIWEDGVSTIWGHQVGGIAYSTERISAEEVPTTWEGCADPQWAGEFVVDTRPSFPFAMVNALGTEGVMELMTQWAANDPVFRRGQTATVETLSAGEYAFLCGAGYDAYRNVSDRGGAVGWQWIDPVPAYPRRAFVMAEANSPNAATLWYLFTYSAEAQEILDRIGNALVTSPSCTCYEDVQGKTVSIAREEDMVQEEELIERIVSEAWQIVED